MVTKNSNSYLCAQYNSHPHFTKSCTQFNNSLPRFRNSVHNILFTLIYNLLLIKQLPSAPPHKKSQKFPNQHEKKGLFPMTYHHVNGRDRWCVNTLINTIPDLLTFSSAKQDLEKMRLLIRAVEQSERCARHASNRLTAVCALTHNILACSHNQCLSLQILHSFVNYLLQNQSCMIYHNKIDIMIWLICAIGFGANCSIYTLVVHFHT